MPAIQGYRPYDPLNKKRRYSEGEWESHKQNILDRSKSHSVQDIVTWYEENLTDFQPTYHQLSKRLKVWKAEQSTTLSTASSASAACSEQMTSIQTAANDDDKAADTTHEPVNEAPQPDAKQLLAAQPQVDEVPDDWKRQISTIAESPGRPEETLLAWHVVLMKSTKAIELLDEPLDNALLCRELELANMSTRGFTGPRSCINCGQLIVSDKECFSLLRHRNKGLFCDNLICERDDTGRDRVPGCLSHISTSTRSSFRAFRSTAHRINSKFGSRGLPGSTTHTMSELSEATDRMTDLSLNDWREEEAKMCGMGWPLEDPANETSDRGLYSILEPSFGTEFKVDDDDVLLAWEFLLNPCL